MRYNRAPVRAGGPREPVHESSHMALHGAARGRGRNSARQQRGRKVRAEERRPRTQAPGARAARLLVANTNLKGVVRFSLLERSLRQHDNGHAYGCIGDRRAPGFSAQVGAHLAGDGAAQLRHGRDVHRTWGDRGCPTPRAYCDMGGVAKIEIREGKDCANSVCEDKKMEPAAAAPGSGGEDEHADEDERAFAMLLRLGVVRPRGCRAFEAWADVVEETRTSRRAAARVRALLRRSCAKQAWVGWVDHVDWLAVTSATACRVSRRQARLRQAAVVHEWRHAVYWRARWRAVAPCITRRWRGAVLRDVTYCWRHTARRLKVLRASTSAFRRRRQVAVESDYLYEWSQCAARMSLRVKVTESAKTRSYTASLRATFQCWSNLLVEAACRSHAAAVVCRRRDSALLWDVYHRWSDWSYTSRQHRRVALRVFDRMRVSTAASHKNMLAWTRLSEKWAEAASDEIKGIGGHLRGHMALALQRGILRYVTKLLRSALRKWSYFRRRQSRMKESIGYFNCCRSCLLLTN
jgi:hypothetical protein